jgi:hypothetical protein
MLTRKQIEDVAKKLTAKADTRIDAATTAEILIQGYMSWKRGKKSKRLDVLSCHILATVNASRQDCPNLQFTFETFVMVTPLLNEMLANGIDVPMDLYYVPKDTNNERGASVGDALQCLLT